MSQADYEKQANEKRRNRILGNGERENPADLSWYDQKRKVAADNERKTAMDQVKRGKRSYNSYDKQYNQ